MTSPNVRCTCTGTCHPETATVEVDGQRFTGRVYHVRENGWPCVETDTGHHASGPAVEPFSARILAATDHIGRGTR